MNFSSFLFGVVVGLAAAMSYALMYLVRYVSNDTDAFVKWLDGAEPAK